MRCPLHSSDAAKQGMVPLSARDRPLEGCERRERYSAECVRSAASLGVLAVVYMCISTGLIAFNKYLVHDGRFAFVIFLVAMHMSFSVIFNLVLFHLNPSLYPSLTEPGKKVEINGRLVFRVLLPIAVCFASQLVLSNMAFLHSSVAFLQMMKQANVVLVYFFSLALSLDTFSCWRTMVLVFIVAATGLTIHGEMQFSLTGFTIQGISMICESLKLTLQGYTLSSSGVRLDALTYVMLVAPLVLVVLSVLLLALSVVPGCPEVLLLPPWSVVVEYRWLLLANGCLALAMNVTHAIFIKRSSATTFVLTGVVMKDAMIVFVGSTILGEFLSPVQVAGFAMQLAGVLVWSLAKAGESTDAPAEDATPAWHCNCLPVLLRPHPVLALSEAKPEWQALQGSDGDLDLGNLGHPVDRSGKFSEMSCASTMAPLDDELDDAESV